MKRTILKIACVAVILYSYSCKKSDNITTPANSSNDKQKVSVTLAPGGDISYAQTVLNEGRSNGSNLLAKAKTARDSVYYCVAAYSNSYGRKMYAFGIFDRPDSIHFDLEKDTSYLIRFTILERGTGGGFVKTDSQILQGPVRGEVKNKMDYGTDIDKDLIRDFSRDALPDRPFSIYQSDSSNTEIISPIGESTVYAGSVPNYKADTANPVIDITMRRLTFGMKYNCPNLTVGRLVVTYNMPYDVVMPQKIYYPETINSSLSIYSISDFIAGDLSYYIPYMYLITSIQWELPNGRNIRIGKPNTSLRMPQRNHVLNINITLPDLTDTGTIAGLQVTDSVFIPATPITFNL